MSDELSPPERTRLLLLARTSIEAHLAEREPTWPDWIDDGPPQGAFVTLRRRTTGALRGCIGTVEGRHPLGRTVARMAVAAALQDPRFPPVVASELPGLRIEISALAPPSPIRPEQVEVGHHGLIVRGQGHSGLLLPQVPEEQGWDREAFLAGTCRKAGLDAAFWRRPEATLLGFTATVFGEDDTAES